MNLIPNYCQHPLYWDPRIHLLYVLDTRRVDAFAAAILETVKPGMVVADVGTGTGILARLALAAGARRVYALERHREILEFARRANEQLQLSDRIVLLHGDALKVRLPERVDVIVSELIGSIGNDEGIGAILCAARRKWLKPLGGRLIPSRIEAFFAPVDLEELWSTIPNVYRDDVLVSLQERPMPFGVYYEVLGLPPSRLLAPEAKLDSIDLRSGDGGLSFSARRSFVLRRPGVLSGLVAWFRARLSRGVVLDTSPWAPSTCWGQAFFPFPRQVKVRAGDALTMRFVSQPLRGTTRPHYKWQGTLSRNSWAVAVLEGSNFRAVQRAEQTLRLHVHAQLTDKPERSVGLSRGSRPKRRLPDTP